MAAWRQKQWKYKNTAPKCPKKEEWVTGISASRLMQTAGNYIQASSKYMAFNIDGHGGGALGVLPLDSSGHISSNLPILYAHGNFVSDFGFSPHDDTLMATTSFDNFVKLWRFSATPSRTVPTEPEITFPELPRRGDALQWNPLVTNLMSVVTGNLLRLYDVSTTSKLFDFECHEDVVQGASWSLDGSLLVTTSKDRLVRLFDPRNNQSAVQSCDGHRGVKDSRIAYVNDNHFITTGFDEARNREVMVYDARNLSAALNTIEIDNSNGTLIPLFDQDTNMLYLAGKGDNNVRFVESTSKKPYAIAAACDLLQIQLKGACLIPKRAVDVMKGEVNRMLVLNKDSVVPIPYVIPRRSYAEFHADVFPDTYSGEPGCDVKEWLTGEAPKVTKMSLNPAMGRAKSEAVPVEGIVPEAQKAAPALTKPENGHGSSNGVATPKEKPIVVHHREEPKATPAAPVKAPRVETKTVVKVETDEHSTQTTPAKASSTNRQSIGFKSVETQTTKPLVWPHLCHPVSVKSTKFRHLKGTPMHKSHRIDNIRNLSNTVPGESDGFALNRVRCAISLKGPAGHVAVLELEKTGKLDDAPLPAFQHGCTVSDFQWDPFDDACLVTASDSGQIWVWRVPAGGLTDVVEETYQTINAHNDKIYSIQFHPLAKNVIASCSQNLEVKVWNLDKETSVTLTGQDSPVLGMAWSANGVFLATFSKDSKIRIYEPRASTSPIREGNGPKGTRGARLVWVCNDSFILASGFDKQSTRVLELYSADDLSVGVASVDLDTAPAILVPHYDPDSHTVFLTARGDSLIQAFEVTGQAPYFQMLSSIHCSSQHQALDFLPKISCDVKQIEFAKVYRLTQTMLEPISVTVPRVKPEYFQDDLFPDTSVTWEPTCTAEEWFQGIDKLPRKISLQPADMEKLSDAPPEEVKGRKYERFDPTTYKTDAEKRDELVSSLTANLELMDGPLPQDLQEGCDSDEWSD